MRAGRMNIPARRRLAACAAALAGAAGLLGAAPASGVTDTFRHTGGVQTFTVPAGVTSIHVRANGGDGGNSGTSGDIKPGGAAHTVAAWVPVTPGQVLYVFVGGHGGHGTSTGRSVGGYNGGGFSGGPRAGAGGGASEVRLTPELLNGSRLVVAGGGGGATSGDGPCGDAACWGKGGHAGEPGNRGWDRPGCVAGGGGGPGRQDGGGNGGLGGSGNVGANADSGLPGSPGMGGHGGSLDMAGGGGGGGYFGGGGGGAGRVFTNPVCFSWPGGGGGGSSYFHPTTTPTLPPVRCCLPDPLVEIKYELVPISNQFSFGKPKLNKRKGTAKLPVEVPGGGTLKLARTKNVKGAQRMAVGAGTVKLSIVPRGAAERKLRKRGRATVKAAITFTPTDGEPRTKTKSLALVKR